MTSTVSTVFARRDESGTFLIVDTDSGMPVTRLDANVYPVGSEFGCRYEHAKGIRLTRADVAKAGIEFEDAADAPPTFMTALSAYRAATTQAERLAAYEAMCEHQAAETDEDGDYETAVDDVLAREGLARPGQSDEEIRSRCTLWIVVDRDAELDGEATAKALREAGEAAGYGEVDVEFTGSDTLSASAGYAPDDELMNSLTDIVRAQAAAYAEAGGGDEEEGDLPRVEGDDGEALDGEEILPASFTYYDAEGTEYAYRYLGQEQYEVRRWMADDGMWWVEPSENIGDEVTVAVFQMIKESA